jgi:hypothetical protein
VERRAIDPRVWRFLKNHVGRLEQLLVLLFLRRNSNRSWTAGDVGAAIRLPSRVVADELEVLGRQHLVDVRLGSDVRYRYAPIDPALDSLVGLVAASYSEQPALIVAFVRRRPQPLAALDSRQRR